jgi:hypothetical protein
LIGTTTARVLLGLSLLPFLYYAGRDQLLHFRVRRVSIAENVLHLVLGVLLAIVIGRAILLQPRPAALALLLFVICGAIDEYIFHRGIPELEHDVHAKEHFALLFFVAVFGALTWVR